MVSVSGLAARGSVPQQGRGVVQRWPSLPSGRLGWPVRLELVSDLGGVPDFPAGRGCALQFASLVPVGADGVRHRAVNATKRAEPAPDAFGCGAAGAGCGVGGDGGGGVRPVLAAVGCGAGFKHCRCLLRGKNPGGVRGWGVDVRPWAWP